LPPEYNLNHSGCITTVSVLADVLISIFGIVLFHLFLVVNYGHLIQKEQGIIKKERFSRMALSNYFKTKLTKYFQFNENKILDLRANLAPIFFDDTKSLFSRLIFL
jgi:hypothetical protein